jgi:hypothetical protein
VVVIDSPPPGDLAVARAAADAADTVVMPTTPNYADLDRVNATAEIAAGKPAGATMVQVRGGLEDAAAQPPGSMLPPPHAGSAGSDGAALPPAGSSPVSWLLAAGAAGFRAGDRDAAQVMQQRFQGTLTQLTGSLFDAGLISQTASDLPPQALRRAVTRAADLLDDTIRHAHTAAFAEHDRTTHTPSSAGKPGTALQPGMSAPAGPPTAADRDAVRLSKLARESVRAQSRYQELKAQTLEAATRYAETVDRVAATLAQLATSHPPRLPEQDQAAEAFTAWHGRPEGANMGGGSG